MIKRNKQFVINGISLPILCNLGIGIKEKSFNVKNSFGCSGRFTVTAITKNSGVQRTQSLDISTPKLHGEIARMPFKGVGETTLKMQWNVNDIRIEKFSHTCKIPEGHYEIGVSPFYDTNILRLGLLVKVYVLGVALTSFKIYPVYGMFIRTDLTLTTSMDAPSAETVKFIGEVMPAKRGIPLSANDATRLAKAFTSRPRTFSEESTKLYQTIMKFSKTFEPTMSNYVKLSDLYKELFKSVLEDYKALNKPKSTNI